MARYKDANWILPERNVTDVHATLATLMDIRHELKQLNTLLHCQNAQDIPFKLDKIVKNTTKPRKAHK